MTEHPILIHPDYWMNSQLSIARYYGGVIYNVRTYNVEPTKNYLVRHDIWKLLYPQGELTLPTIERLAKKQYDEAKSVEIAKRLSAIIKCRRKEGIKEETGTLNF